MRRGFGLLALLFLLSFPVRARAWDDVKEIIHGSARVLERGEMLIGVLSPLVYGIHERVTLFTHPALHLFLTPNFWGRLAILDGDSALAVDAGYQQSFLSIQSGDSNYPGFVQLGGIYSLRINPDVQVNVAAGYLLTFEETRAGTHAGLYWRAGVNWLVEQVNLIQLDIRGNVLAGHSVGWPVGSVIFARQFGRMRLGAGLLFGEFSLAAWNAQLKEDPPSPVELPIYPWFDLWWRF